MNALISVSDKTGILKFAQALHALGIKLLSIYISLLPETELLQIRWLLLLLLLRIYISMLKTKLPQI